MFEESVALRRELGDDAGSSVSLANLALVARDRGELDAAEAMLREAKATRERLGDRQRVAVVRHNLALVLFDRGDLAAARAELEAALVDGPRARRSAGDGECAVGSRVRGGRGGRARARGRMLQGEALVVAARIGAKGIVAQSIDGVAGLVAATAASRRRRRSGRPPSRSGATPATTCSRPIAAGSTTRSRPPAPRSTRRPGGRPGPRASGSVPTRRSRVPRS